MKKAVFSAVLWNFVLLISSIQSGFAANTANLDLWNGLIERLSGVGIERSYLESIYSRREVAFEPRTMPRKLLHKERPFDYKKFYSPERIERAVKFIKKNQSLLNEIENKYGVPSTLKTAILLVETDLGRYTGPYRIINVLSSMAISSDISRISPWLPKEIMDDTSALARYKKKAKKKADWAFGELKAFFTYCRANKIDPVEIKGSPFGAFGLCQFVPSSVLRFGVDYDRDGRIDLFTLGDALASMANYLVKNGWHSGISKDKAFRCILTYNRSRPYAKTILEVASILEKRLDQ